MKINQYLARNNVKSSGYFKDLTPTSIFLAMEWMRARKQAMLALLFQFQTLQMMESLLMSQLNIKLKSFLLV